MPEIPAQNEETASDFSEYNYDLLRLLRQFASLKHVIIIIKHAYAVQLNSFTRLTALLALHDHAILAHVTNITGHYHHLTNITPAFRIFLHPLIIPRYALMVGYLFLLALMFVFVGD